MSLTKKDLDKIKDVVAEVTEPYFNAIKRDFDNVDEKFVTKA